MTTGVAFSLGKKAIALEIIDLGVEIEKFDQTTLAAVNNCTTDPAIWDIHLGNLRDKVNALIVRTGKSTGQLDRTLFVFKGLEQHAEMIVSFTEALPERIALATESFKRNQKVKEIEANFKAWSGSKDKNPTEAATLRERAEALLMDFATSFEQQKRVLAVWEELPPPPPKSAEFVALKKIMDSLKGLEESTPAKRGTALNPALKALPESISGEIYKGIWVGAGSPDGDPHFGENHIGDDLNILKELLTAALKKAA